VHVVPVLHRRATLRRNIRRGLPRRGWRVERCLSVDRLTAMFERRLLDAVVFDARDPATRAALELIPLYPGIPFFAAGSFRPGDAALMRSCLRAGAREILVDGVDDLAAGELILRKSASGRRQSALADAPRLLRLTEPIQHRAWEEVLARVGQRTTTADIAKALRRTREHLSREFGAGGAPNLKRVIDLVRIAWAADMLADPGYSTRTVAALLRFASGSHLADCSRRVAGVAPADLPALGPRGVLQRFAKGRTRSRI
jgi:AraC-like DNA-binding protein